MPEPIPTPDLPPIFSRKWWLHWSREILPSNWREVVRWFILAGSIWLLNLVRGPDAIPIPTPGPVIPIWEPPPEGWQPPSMEERQQTLLALKTGRFSDTDAGQELVGEGDSPVWRLAIKGRGKPIPDRNQLQVGSCVSFGFNSAGEYTAAAQVAIGKQRQELPDFVHEITYAGSRINADPRNPINNGDGSTGSRAAKWLETVGGFVRRNKYPNDDLTEYNEARCRKWGNAGVPDYYVMESKKHSAKCSLVSSATQAKTALAQGYAIGICSNVGFDSNKDQSGKPTRDADGFLKPAGQWGHCMAVIGYRADKPGFLILNSWGADWVQGPKGAFDDIPNGSFWATESIVDRMLKQGDSYAVANAAGFVRRKIAAEDWIVQVAPSRQNRLGVFYNVFARIP